MINHESYFSILNEVKKKNALLVAVSKTRTPDEIMKLYELGQRDFGENYVQELVEKHSKLPTDIRWHFIGHLQTNKVKYISPFIHLIHGADSLKILKEINRQGEINKRILHVLIQVHIAMEETKFGVDVNESEQLINEFRSLSMNHCFIDGLMGMASQTSNEELIRNEFGQLYSVYKKQPSFSVLSMGMSGDYKIALEMGSNMVRIGSLLFGERRSE